ncbi:hypothetical protein [Arenimonas sp.]|uniref:hypothetical protein n=1 Tax=Arenimonas sp. TaxID=1872635 RepID=UPI0035B4BE28
MKPSTLASLLVMAIGATGAAGAREAPVLAAADLVETSLLAGPGWRVDPQVEVRGYQARFRIYTDWGEMEADSVELLAVRVAEMPALAAVHEARPSRIIGEAARARATKPVQAGVAVGREPGRAVLGLPGGVARYFADKWQRLRRSVRRLADISNEELMHAGDPFAEPGGPLGAAGSRPRPERRGIFRRLGKETERLAKHELGYSSARRALALRLGVDPGTRNPLLSPRLNALAWAETSGRHAAGHVLGLVGGPAMAALSRAVQVDDWVLSARPEQVRKRNRERLELHCLDGLLTRAFLRERAYGTVLQTDLVRLLDGIDPTDGCEILLETALMAGDEAQARFVVQELRQLDAALAPEERGGRFIAQGALMAYLSPQGELLLPLPVDRLDWTDEMDRWFGLEALSHPGPRRVLVAGQVSPEARWQVQARGWRLQCLSDYAGRPPYRASCA